MRSTARRRIPRDWWWALLFLGPNLALFLAFTFVPILFGFGVSFFRWTIIEPPVFVGLGNYIQFFVGDPLMPKVINNSLVYTLGALPVSVLLPLGLAVLLNSRIRGRMVFRGIYFLPLVTSAVATATIFKWIYAKQAGPINQLVGLFGFPRQDWLFDEKLVLPALIIATIWHRVPFNIIFYLAALQGVPASLYEAAKIDGANRWQEFRYVTWPLVTPTTFFVLIITTINLLVGSFDMINVMTQGGPLDASNVLVFNIWRTAFVYFQMGYASAMAYILFLIVLGFTALQWIFQKRWVHY
ncbi:MAG: sugar ABC transporter permease [Chloroflexi bacterium]|nr:sugar ABC transporter permease [Chloroflexota bacterium]